MATMTESTGTIDKRIDDLRSDTNQGFARVDADIRELRSDLKSGFDSVDTRFDSMQRLMTRFFAGTLGTIIAGVIVAVASHS